jgi:hypothetical protein
MECIQSLATYLGKTYTTEQIEQLICFTSFNNIKKVAGLDFKAEIKKQMYERDMSFFRKGQIGDWYNHFSEELSSKVDDVVKRNIKSDIKFNYGNKPIE